jgi:hypothetical protein
MLEEREHQRVVQEESYIFMVDKLSDHVDFRVLALYDVVLENCFSIKQILLLVGLLLSFLIIFLRLVVVIVIILLVLTLVLMMLDVWGQDHNLFGSHQVYSIV